MELLAETVNGKKSKLFLQKISIIYIRQIPKYAFYEIQKNTGDHLISTHAKFSEHFFLPDRHMSVYQGISIVSFSEKLRTC